MNSKKINNYSNQNKINFIDTHEEIFKNYENKIELFSYYIPYHLNGKGYKLVADLISKKIR